jgi:ABC-type transport system involved in cytochrome c biogenesis ATPase subunit
MLFAVVPVGTPVDSSPPDRAYLVRDNWNDWWRFITMFDLIVFDADGSRHEVGNVKIGQFQMAEGQQSPHLPEEFDALPEQFFSLGQSENYYETLNAITDPLRLRILAGLRDVAVDLAHFDRALGEPVMQESLLREIGAEKVRGRLHRLSMGDARLTEFAFAYQFPALPARGAPLAMHFKVNPDRAPPTNVHVLIGRNGVGKTRCLNNMSHALVERGADTEKVGAFFWQDGHEHFAGLVSVAFSAFDPFGPLRETRENPHAIRYAYVGLRREEEGELGGTKALDDLVKEFVKSVVQCRRGARLTRWHRALETLESDPLFQEADVAALSDANVEVGWEERAETLYRGLSAGHKIVLLTITRLVEVVDEKTLVLMDEPEAHLHPPLLSALVRAISDLLVQRNGVAIVATHSPVVLQEVPMECVWILRRRGAEAKAERPEIQTFGENVGVLTREIFGLEVTKSGYHKLLEEAVARPGISDYDDVMQQFGHRLGGEAQALARALLAERDANTDEPA